MKRVPRVAKVWELRVEFKLKPFAAWRSPIDLPWSWPSFAAHRRSIFDWAIEPEAWEIADR